MATQTLITDVTLNWAKLEQPIINVFNATPQWELQMVTDSKQEADRWANELSLNVKDLDGSFAVNLRRNAVKKDGSQNDPVRLVDAKKNPMDSRKIGNGSKGNVIIYQDNYDFAGKTGVYTILAAVQVIDLVEFSGGSDIDFDIVEPDGDSIF